MLCFLRFLLLGLLLPAAAVAAEPDFPKLTGRVVDEAGLLDSATRTSLARLLESHERDTANQVVVVTLKSLQGFEIEDFGYRLGRHWGIGSKVKEAKNNGVLLIVAPNERRVRIEVGYGLEGVLTDALAKTIIETAVVPRFRQGDFRGGIGEGVRTVLAVLKGEYKPRAVGEYEAARSGAGGETRRAAAGADGEGSDALGGAIPFLLLVAFLAFRILFLPYGLRRPFAPGIGRGVFYGGGGFGGGLGGGGFGGGFSGGGGSFGGGGASGRW